MIHGFHEAAATVVAVMYLGELFSPASKGPALAGLSVFATGEAALLIEPRRKNQLSRKNLKEK